MGGPAVLAHTRAALGNPAELEPWPDVDTAPELNRLEGELERDPAALPAVAVWLAGR